MDSASFSVNVTAQVFKRLEEQALLAGQSVDDYIVTLIATGSLPKSTCMSSEAIMALKCELIWGIDCRFIGNGSSGKG